MIAIVFAAADAQRDLERVDDDLIRVQSLSSSLHQFGEFNREYLLVRRPAALANARAARGEALAELDELGRIARARGWGDWFSEVEPLVRRRLDSSDVRVKRSLETGELDRLAMDIDRRLDAMQEYALALQQTARLHSRRRRSASAAACAALAALSLALLALSFRRLARAESALRHFAEALVRAEQRERRRIAQILHDGLQQGLAAAAMHVNAIARRPGEPESRVSAELAGAILKEAAQTARALSYELCPPDIAQGTLGRSLRWLAEQMRSRHKLEVVVLVEDEPAQVPDSIRDFCFGAARELLFNVVKHANAPAATVTIGSLPGRLRLEVRDDGAGFDVAAGSAGSAVLAGIRERAGLFGGSLEISSRRGKGCRVRLLVPLPKV